MSSQSSPVARLVSTSWLAERLDDPTVRIVDATVCRRQTAEGRIEIRSGRSGFEAEHIPGAAFADLVTDFSAPTPGVVFALPTAERFADAVGALGIENHHRIVIYSRAEPAWATRLWWLLRLFGFDGAAILDGGFRKWKAEGRPVTDQASVPTPAVFTVRRRSDLLADKEEVVAHVEGRTPIRLVDALSAEHFRGDSGPLYGRAGHIPGAVNCPAAELLDPVTGCFLAPPELQQKLAPALDHGERRTVVYCGGGIAATAAAFALALVGRSDAAVYNGSLQEWAKDPLLPMATGTEA